MKSSSSILVHPLAAPTLLKHHAVTIPWVIVLLALLLGMIGVLALYSASSGNWSPWAGQHILRICVGLGLMVGIAMIPIWYFRSLALWGWGAIVVVLGLLEVFGGGPGAQRWLTVGGFNLQPSEPAKLAVIILLAAYFHTINPEVIRKLRTYVPAFLIVMIPFTLVLLQPDLGTAIMLLGSAAAVVFVVGIPKWMILAAAGLVAAAVPAIWTSLYPYQKDRVLIFLNPGADQLGAGYQITQSKIALGSGGIFGKGYLQGSQAHLNYLPEKQTDFVFTMVGEEFGFLGCLLILSLYISMVAIMIRLSLHLEYKFSRLLVMGIAAKMFLFAFVNIAMVTGLIPVVGAPLPLISYGGTALMTVFISIGLVISAIVYDSESASL
jgi:rod shape determining protein RodA